MAQILLENIEKSEFDQADIMCGRYQDLLAELISIDPDAKRFLPDLQIKGSGAIIINLENRLREAKLASAQMIGYLQEKLATSSSIKYDKERVSIGAIANFFGMKMGKYRDERMFESLGIKNVPGNNKPERISNVLQDTFHKDRKIFEQVMSSLVKYHDLSEDNFQELNRLLLPLGYTTKEGRIVPATPGEIIEEEAKPFTAYKEIEKIIMLATKEIKIMDAYVDQSLFPLYFHDLPPKVSLKILTKKMFDKFEEVAKKFKQQKSNFEVRKSNKFHDRYLIIDRRAWMIGQSIKDAGSKPFAIVEIEDVDAVLTMFDRLWNVSTKVL